jgi:hypothetical protein
MAEFDNPDGRVAGIPTRPAIPSALARRVKVEAGHRCAIPSCRTVPVELAHIVPWRNVREHTFENLIALCPTCHTRYDRGDIDRQSMMQYKANLSVLNSRYGDLERRVLHLFASDPPGSSIQLGLDSNFHMMYLIEDGLFIEVHQIGGMFIGGEPIAREFLITSAGIEFVKNWLSAQPLEPPTS